ncbi:MAG: MG2 domain-containing protein [Planctomycetota bacterium]
MSPFRLPARRLFVGLLALLALAARSDADPTAGRDAALLEAAAPLVEGDPGAAAERLRRFREAHTGTPEAREAWILEARAWAVAGRPGDALEAAIAFVRAHPDDAWAGRARHLAAEAYEALGRAGEATPLLAVMAEATTSPQALDAFARKLLEEGRRDIEGVDATDDLGRTIRAKDLPRAASALERALALAADDGLRREALAWRVRGAEEQGDHPAVIAAATRLLDLDKASALALAARGRARLATQDTAGARADLLLALPLVAAGEDADAHRRVVEALAAERFLAAGRGDEAALEEATDRLRALIAARPAVAPEARLFLAGALHGIGRMEEAAAEHRAFVDRFPNHADVPRAREMAIDELAAAGRHEDALRDIERFLTAHPDDPRWTTLRDRRPQLGWQLATSRLAEGQRDAAIQAWRDFLQQWPTDNRAPDALLAIAAVQVEDDNVEAALTTWREVMGRYGKTSQAPIAALRRADALEGAGRLDEAIEAYEQIAKTWPHAGEAGEAARRLQRLRAPELRIGQPQVGAVGQAPEIEVVTRNIEALDVRVHALDLEAWFREKGTILGVDSLALEIVKPDVTATWKTASYAPFRRFEAKQSVPVTQAGAYVVVAGDTQLTATSLVLVSDVECVVKKGERGSLLVWVFERGSEQPVAGARVLVNDAKGVRELGATGADGVWEGRADGAAKQVFVSAGERGVASTELADAAWSSEGLSTKAYLHTDRPVYRPGDEVSWRAVFLQVRDGQLTLPGVTKGLIEVLDARNNVLTRDEIVSSASGTFDGTFGLDALASIGTWTLRLTVPRQGTWTGTFEVEAYRKPELLIDIAPTQPTYATGDTVEATVNVTYTFGAPAADVAVTWEAFRQPRAFDMPDPDDVSWYLGADTSERARSSTRGLSRIARGEGKTDEAGRLAISVTTAESDPDAEILVRAVIEDVTGRFVMDEGRVPVTRLDHMALVRPGLKLVRPKQTLRVEVRTVDAGLAPVARSGELILLRVVSDVTRLAGEATRRESSWPVATGADGRAELSVSLPAPGRWRLRYEGRDGRGRLVVHETDVEARGDEEEESRDARLLVSRVLFREGDTAEVLLRSPVRASQALLTLEAGTVLEHRFVAVEGPSTVLKVPLRAAHAPNVVVAIAIPGPDRLLEAKVELVVVRQMDVRVEAVGEARPGEPLDIAIRTTDAQGRPVAAEVGLSVVDEAIFGIAPDSTASIARTFLDRRRAHTVVTSTSLGTAFHGSTREANRDLLDQQSALDGGAQVEVQHALRLARAAMDRGNTDEALSQVLRALDCDPTSWDARDQLRAIQAERRRQGIGGAADELASLAAKAQRAKGDDLEEMSKELADAEPAPDAAMDKLSDAPYEGAARNGTIGIGGGAGGSFRGRGGRRNLDARGGGGVKGGLLLEKAWFDADRASAASRRVFRDTAHWAPRVKTGADGKATVSIELPDNLTRWRLDVRGVSDGALPGSGRGGFDVGRPIVTRLDAPRFLVQGDEVVLPVAVHAHTEVAADGRVVVTAEGVRLESTEQPLRVEPGQPGVMGVRAFAEGVTPVRLEARFESPVGGDGVEAALATQARGVPWLEGRSGLVQTSGAGVDVHTITVPAEAIAGSTRLEMAIAPSWTASVDDVLVRLRRYPYGCVEQTVHRFLPALQAATALEAVHAPDAARRAQLKRLVADGARRLVQMQNADGSFGWFAGRSGNLAMTAYALRGLRAAIASGESYAIPAAQKALRALDQLLPGGTPDEQALAHLARSEGGTVDAEAFALTFRRRDGGLSTTGLAWLTRAALRADRRRDADELIRLLLAQARDDGTRVSWSGRADDDFVGSDVEATAAALTALVEAKVASDKVDRGLAWLLAQGTPRTTKDGAAFVELASVHMKSGRDQGFGGTVTVLLDGEAVHRIEIVPGQALPAARRAFVLSDAAKLAPGAHKIEVRLSGQGRVAYALRMRGAAASEDLPGASRGMDVKRAYVEAIPGLVAGQEPPPKPGHTIWREEARPAASAAERNSVGRGDMLRVRLEVRTASVRRYVLVEDPLPAGFEVVADSASGPHAWQERRDDRQVFFLDTLPVGTTTIEYVIQATHQGAFTALGSTAEAMYAPEVYGRGSGTRLRIGAPGSNRPGDAEGGPTPDELWALAQKAVAEGRHAEARGLLDTLRQQPLRDAVLDELEALRLDVAIGLGDAPGIVEAREELVRRAPGRLPTSFAALHAMAAAYRTTGDFVVSNALYRDLVARGLGLAHEWTDALVARGRVVEGLDDLGVALEAQPISNASAQLELQRAERLRQTARPKDRDLPAGKPMDEESISVLRHASLHHATTPAEPVLRYALVEALRTTGREGDAAQEAESFLRRHGQHHLMDEVRWFLAESRFRAFEREPNESTEAAVKAAAQPLLDHDVPQANGGKPRPSVHRAAAWHLLARMRHALGDLDAAATLYKRAGGIEDAQAAAAWLAEQRLELPVTRVVTMGAQARGIVGPLTVPLTTRNIEKVAFEIYPVDLQVLFAVRRSLKGLHEIQLTGIRPQIAFEHVVGRQRMEKTEDVSLPEVTGHGAWLVVARADGRATSTLVVSTDLEVRWQRDAGRLHVLDVQGQPVRDAFVTVAQDDRIRLRARTDARGIVEVPGVAAGAEAVVSVGDRFAIARAP